MNTAMDELTIMLLVLYMHSYVSSPRHSVASHERGKARFIHIAMLPGCLLLPGCHDVVVVAC